MEKSGISHIIFDLGGVLIDLNTQRTVEAFQELSSDPHINWKEVLAHPHLLDYEQGHITDAQFREGVREHLSITASDDQIDDAWNAMILEFPNDRFELIESLAKSFNILLLSNTNEIHLRHVNDKIRKHGYNQLDDLFTTAYYSQRLKLRKPNVSIYHEVIKRSNLVPSGAIFIDDNLHNVHGAREAGLHAHHLTRIEDLPEFFRDWH